MSNHRMKTLSSLIMLCISSLLIGSAFQQNFNALAQTLTPEPPISTAQLTWVSISDPYYGYSFQIPSTWYKEMGVTPDRWSFFSDPSVVGNEALQPIRTSNGLIKIDFAVEPVANLLPAPETRNPLVDELGNSNTDALVPYLPAGTWTTIDDMPALLVHYSEEELSQGHAEFFTEATSVYILGDRLVYYLWIAYAPPASGKNANTAFGEIQNFILQSFSVDPKPLAASNPTE